MQVCMGWACWCVGMQGWLLPSYVGACMLGDSGNPHCCVYVFFMAGCGKGPSMTEALGGTGCTVQRMHLQSV
jgi:hypothetical protein